MPARHLRPLAVPLLALGIGTTLPAAASAQFHPASDDRWCAQEQDGDDEGEQYCEVRELTLPASQLVSVDASPNGGIQVQGGRGGQVRIEARVIARAETMEAARAMAGAVQIDTRGTIRASGPDERRRRRGWHVSYRLQVPAGARLDLSAQNGGISIEDFDGTAEFRTVNGGVRIARSRGRLRGETTNGGVDVTLGGTEWAGEGLDVQTTNGGVKLSVPEDYNARLQTGTVNGGLDVRFPIQVEGQIKHNLEVTLGRGGAPVRAVTTNGGVVLRRP
jgi:hypothetical protein